MNSNDARETSLSARTLSGLGWSYLSTFIKALFVVAGAGGPGPVAHAG